ncbi:MAG: hypothetical protein OES12_09355 [Anaerolineae bacterium]|nr:hypothetical protein [Anaerolineae bacterium]
MTEEALIFTLVIVLMFFGLILFFLARVRVGHRPDFRRIQAYDALRGLGSRAVEAGRPLHLSLGTGSMANESTADSMAGLSILNYLADQAAATGSHPMVSMADPTVMLFAQNAVKAAQDGDIPGTEEAYRNIRWIAPQSAAYAAGVMSLLSIDDVESNIMVGKFGDEYLLMGETAARREIAHVGGTSDPNTLPLVYVSAQEALLGEEIYAGGAYLQKLPAHIGSLLAQDTMRWIVALTILGGVILATLGRS